MKILYLMMLILLPFGLSSQDDTLEVDFYDIIILDVNKDDFILGGGPEVIQLNTNSVFNLDNIGEKLKYSSSNYIRSNGLGLLSTPLTHGLAGRHTKILWQGIELNSSMNGLSDLSLIPAPAFDKIKIYNGGFTSLLGQGAIGGAIDVQSEWLNNEGLELDLYSGYSDTGNIGIALNSNYRKAYFTHYSFASFQDFDNKYNYNHNGETLEQEHSNFKNISLITGLQTQLNKNTFDLHFWYQETDRQIPDTKISAFSDQFQSDHILRSKLSWIRNLDRGDIEFKSAYLRENIFFQSKVVFPTESIFERWHNEVNYFLNKGDRYYYVGSSFDLDHARFDVENDVSRKHLSLYGGVKNSFLNGKGNLSLSIRQSLVDENLSPSSYSLSLDYNVFRKIQLVSKVERVYSLPTINDQYWPNLGNAELKPEKGWSYDFKMRSNDVVNSPLKWELSLFGYYIQDWILWFPDASQVWKPQNTRAVLGEGISAYIFYSIPYQGNDFRFSLNYSFTRSTVKEDDNTNAIGHQLVFVPFHKIGSTMGFYSKKVGLSYDQSFVGGHFLNVDNSVKTEPYYVADLSLVYKLLTKSQYSVELAVKIKNLWNSNYEVVSSYPMPLRYFDLGFHIRYNK